MYLGDTTRVMKQALRSSGANCTPKRTEDMSTYGLSLLDAAKKADQEFQILSRSSHRTVRNAECHQKDCSSSIRRESNL